MNTELNSTSANNTTLIVSGLLPAANYGIIPGTSTYYPSRSDTKVDNTKEHIHLSPKQYAQITMAIKQAVYEKLLGDKLISFAEYNKLCQKMIKEV